MNTYAPFGLNKPCWHLCTDGNVMPNIFSSGADFDLGLNVLAVVACFFPDVDILTFILMSNHIHLVMSGREEDCLEFFALYKNKLSRCLREKAIDWRPFDPSLYLIDSEDYLKKVIAYVPRFK